MFLDYNLGTEILKEILTRNIHIYNVIKQPSTKNNYTYIPLTICETVSELSPYDILYDAVAVDVPRINSLLHQQKIQSRSWAIALQIKRGRAVLNRSEIYKPSGREAVR